MYHRTRSVATKPGKTFSTLSALLQCLEAAAEIGKGKALKQVVKFMAGSSTLADIGFEVKLTEK